MPPIDFHTAFRTLTGHLPFPWQQRLYRRFLAEEIPAACLLPTGMGKTSVLAIWLLALANAPAKVPRRLVYVVNRRTVVDQSSDEARKIARNIPDVPDLREALDALATLPHQQPLAISTLRGQLADNREWRVDPARPAMILGTVDMIGSRLLFGGYGCGFKSQPLHAGFLGQDSLLIHDEAHLEPAFQTLLEAVHQEQQRCRERKRLRVMQLTATARTQDQAFELDADDFAHPIIHQRYHAKKHLTFVKIDDETALAAKLAELALAKRECGEPVLVFARSLRVIEEVDRILDKAKLGQQVRMLTGVMRGHERDELVADPVFQRFLKRSSGTGTCYLLCTSAGEVGVDMTANHLVCDLSPFDSMAQRFGRVNRYGGGEAHIQIVHGPSKDDNEIEERRQRTLTLLESLPDGNASPANLAALDPEKRGNAFAPEPFIPETDAMLLDGWAATTVRDECPQRPELADWLHGITPRDEPETTLAWRHELDEKHLHATPEELLELYPLKPNELLRAPTSRVQRELRAIATRGDGKMAWIVQGRDRVQTVNVSDLPDAELAGRTVVLPASVGGLRVVHGDDGKLTIQGTLDGTSATASDVADEWYDPAGERMRYRTFDETEEDKRFRRVRRFVLEAPETDDDTEAKADTEPRVWSWFVRPRQAEDASGSWSATQPQELDAHLLLAERYARELASALGLPDDERDALVFAARYHDVGKARELWQRGIGNRDYPSRVLAKSGGRGRPEQWTRYRHELGSLIEVRSTKELAGEALDLALHLIAAHHGRARPHFPPEEVFDPERPEREAQSVAVETPRRFARLQRRYGRWGLAYLESLLRAVDALASEERS